MPTRFVCLANSYKEGGRCVAGIVLDNNNNPIMQNSRPRWIRPVSNAVHGEIHSHLVTHINILDIVEIDDTGKREDGYQSENVSFNENTIRKTGTFPKNNLIPLCEDKISIFGNRGKAVSEEKINTLNHSLMLICVNNFEAVDKIYEDNKDKHQTRLVFTYSGNNYDLPVTDPIFMHRFKTTPHYIEGIAELFLTLSLGVSWNNWYYKLVAGVTFK
jgi:hypothetical protein